MANHSHYTNEIGDTIANLIAEDYTYERISAIEGMPCKKTIINWLRVHEDFYTKCARARIYQADSIDNRIGDVIDNTQIGLIQPDVARVVISGLQWRASKKDPKKYGDKQSIDMKISDPLTKEQRDAAVAAASKAES